MNKKLTFAITACNEINELKKLVATIANSFDKNICDIKIFLDINNSNEHMNNVISTILNVDHHILFHENALRLIPIKFNSDFSEFKNQIIDYCDSDYIFQIDADELPSEYLIKTLPAIIDENPDLEIMYVPRINTVDNITDDLVKKWHWNISKIDSPLTIDKFNTSHTEQYRQYIDSLGYTIDKHEETFYKPVINFPDYQGRVFKNGIGIRWKNKVHERLGGDREFNIQLLPSDDLDFFIIHSKTVDKQIIQNSLYDNI